MVAAVFLSAGMPDPQRGPEYAATADPVAITSAVAAAVHVLLGRRLLVFGGQPAITPMIWAMAEHLGVSYNSWVHLYQSLHFKDRFPEDNARYQNTTFTDDRGDTAASLEWMRAKMFSDHQFEAAIFIGGMKGIEDEFSMLRERQPALRCVAIRSTGGASAIVANRLDPQLAIPDSLDYIMLLHEQLAISPKEMRYDTPNDQPADLRDRIWGPKTT